MAVDHISTFYDDMYTKRNDPDEKMFFGRRQRLSYVPIIVFIFLIPFALGYNLLPDDEVNALRQAAETLGKTNWNFSADPCSGESGWVTPNPAKGFENAVTCNCSDSYNGTLCHVISMEENKETLLNNGEGKLSPQGSKCLLYSLPCRVLKAQNLPGVLPPELVRLPYLQQIDFSRNYLRGRIPPEWGSLQLVNISLIGNCLSGPIPKEISNITTLRELTLDYNQLSGDLPPEFGNLVNIERVLISSNNFTGQLPGTLSKLANLRDFRISDNHFSGKIPSFIKNWTKLEKLVIQASGLEGPIPSEISLLENISDMRISDINGKEAVVPPLSNLTSIKTLILRSCNLIGDIPSFLGEMKKLKELDLSFNKLTGAIPSSFESFSKLDLMYLTGNLLSGTVPDWMPMKGESIDLSYNNFTLGSSGVPSCQRGHVNLFGNPYFGNDLGGIVACLQGFYCPRKWYSLYINCGGREVTINGSAYGADQDTASPSKFFQSGYNWAFSSTGSFLDDDKNIDDYIATNTSRLSMDSKLYTTARLSPLSLTYYGYCLVNGNYTVNLHFAEIVFTNDKAYSSLGRRIFDVYIQGKLALKDFNIMDEAGGAGKEVIKTLSAIVVASGTLEIRFYWAGRGTTGIPSRGTYGPLISAISVDPDFVPAPEDGKKMPATDVVGIVASVVCLVLLVLAILHYKGCMGCTTKMSEDNDNQC
ncbi:probable leucine-rich repeat receptor-like serine/threonine-protein kinase At3g14840 [Macadamia integrifolia]|uniref:probable leucine-rich repeat receptor-like serine/threonine-protein kinase At3g14840 n=1 Tax=Macadamia integrifolia TaxID=60698 RepID=UPI001C4ED04B|nr:probable leucine-rich repeat receptor-like serine/threonine-protein kinase At3g14840 [Macadamia integrifolia]